MRKSGEKVEEKIYTRCKAKEIRDRNLLLNYHPLSISGILRLNKKI
jgi:hypothetical protein